MNVIVNSENRNISAGTLLSELLSSEGVIGKGGVAVAINGNIVGKKDWEARMLMEGDDIIIINAAYGG